MSDHAHHISNDKQLLSVGGALLFFTLATVGVHYLALPHPWAVIAALFIAVIKGGLVALFFMNLYWDDRFNAMIFAFAFIFLSLLVGLSLMDTLFRIVPVPSF